MRIAYITPYYPPETVGGAEISLMLLANTLAQLGHKICVFVPNYEKKDEVNGKNPKVFRFKFGKDGVFSKNNPVAISYFAKKVVDCGEKFDIFDAYKWYLPARIVCQKLDLPLICSIRDTTPVCDFRVDAAPREYSFFEYFKRRFSTYGVTPRQVVNAIYGFLLTKQNLQIISQASCLTFASAALAKIFKKYNQCGHVVNSIGLIDFKREDIEIEGVDFDKDKVVVYSGRLTYGKGAGFLFEAATEVVKNDKFIKFVFVGDGELQDRISDKKFLGRIFCIGRQSHDFVLSLVEKSTLTVIPSLVFEGFPRMGIESVSLGTPVVGTDVGGIGEAIGDAGVLVEPGNIKALADEILEVCNDKNLYLRLKAETKSQAAKFIPEKISKKVLNVYYKVLLK